MRVLMPVAVAMSIVALTSVGCGSDDEGGGGGGAAGGGAGVGGGGSVSPEYYEGAKSAALGASGNEAECATCHANAAGARGYSGDSLLDIAYKTSFKGGDAPTSLDAANACITGWMGGTALTSGSAEWQSLEAYLQSISDEANTTPNTLMPEVLADEAAYEAAYAGGNAANGQASYDTFCAKCHASARRVGPAVAISETELAAFTIGRIAQKVRTSGPPPSGTADASDTTPGPMPFFEPDELSAGELADIIAYLKQ